MKSYELTNRQRAYFGLDPIEEHWDKLVLQGDTYRPDSILYYEGDIIKRHIVSTENGYRECQYNELTRDREFLLPKTAKGKEKKLTASVFEKRKASGVYLMVDDLGILNIGNFNTQTTFYSTHWERNKFNEKVSIEKTIDDFINNSPENHFDEIEKFKAAKRKNVKYKAGDYFRFKLDRTAYGFGRILLDVHKARKKGLIADDHGLSLLMGPPVIVQIYAFRSTEKEIDLSILESVPKLPADIMMDNLLLYGEYEIIGHQELQETDFEFPISYGRALDDRQIVFLQWGLIHLELPKKSFSKYLTGEKAFDQNPYGYYGIGFSPAYDGVDVRDTLHHKGVFDYAASSNYRAEWDLRNPKNKEVKREIFEAFGLDPDKSYQENCKLTGTTSTTAFLKQLK